MPQAHRKPPNDQIAESDRLPVVSALRGYASTQIVLVCGWLQDVVHE
jgi:hypothetical protein